MQRILFILLIALTHCHKKNLTAFCSVGSAELNMFMDHLGRLNQEEGGSTFQHEGRGNGVGPAALLDGSCLIAPMSRKMQDREIHRLVNKTGKQPLAIPFALDAFAMITKQDAEEKKISPDQIFTIYHKGPGGSPYKQAFRINTASERYHFFKAIAVKGQSISDQILELPDHKRLVDRIGASGGLGFARLAELTPEVKPLILELDFGQTVKLRKKTVRNGLYPFTRYYYLYLHPEIKSHPEKNKAIQLIKLAISQKGQALLEPLGLYKPRKSVIQKSLKALSDL